MIRWNRWTTWVSLLLVVALLSGCANAANYVKDSYPLVNVDGKGKTTAKVYEAEGKTVPEVAKEISDQEKPQETSKEDPDQMFLMYDNRIVNLQKNPENPSNTLIEVNSIEYAKQHYDSSFLEGFVTAAIIQSILGGDWSSSSYKKYPDPYKGYSGSSAAKKPSTALPSTSSSSKTDEKKPATTDRTGSFNSKGSTSTGSSTPPASGSTSTSKPSTGSSSNKSSGSWSSSNSGSVRKSDGSTPSTKSSSKPSTSKRSGSFSSKKR